MVMQLAEVKEHIMKKNPQPFYIFAGEEVAVMSTYIDKLAQACGGSPVRLDTVAQAYKKMQAGSLVGSERNCFVVRDDKEFQQQEKMWSQFCSGQAQRGNVLILLFSNLDKRAKFYKQNSDYVTFFEKMPGEMVAKHLMKQGLPQVAAEQLASVCENDYSRALLELDKIKAYAAASRLDAGMAMKRMLSAGAIFSPPRDAIFDLVDAICRRKKEAHAFWRDSKAVGESPVVVLSVLYKNMRAMLLYSVSGGGSGVCDRTGLTPFEAKLAKEKLGAYSVDEMRRALKLIRKTEKGIKTGEIDQDVSVDYLLAKLL